MAVANGGRDDDRSLETEQELAFSESSDRLPWLESDDDEEAPPADTGRMVAFALVGLMGLLVLLGALWWFTRERTDDALVADGSTIEAPEGPYKVRPADPGGREVAGTGDTSFQVAEGREVEGRIAQTPAPSPSLDVTPRASATPGASPTSGATMPVKGIGVQVGAYSSRAAAEAGWQQLTARLEPLHGHSHRILEGTADSGTVFRLQAVAGSAEEADTLCRAIKASGGDCQVKR